MIAAKKIPLFLSSLFCLCLIGELLGERPAKPNILLVMVDDMGIGDTSAYLGKRLMPNAEPIQKTLYTPNLESFSKQARVFTDAHAPASMCSSTRYSLLTGRFAHRAYLKHQGWLPHGPNSPMIRQAMRTLPEMLRENGYHTKGVGKYHVGVSYDNGDGQPASDFYFHDVDFAKPLLDGPTHHGFDEYYGVPGNTEDPLDTEPRVMIVNDGYSFTDKRRMKYIGMNKRAGKILAQPDWDLKALGQLYLDEMERYLTRQSVRGSQPFFLYFVPNANHNQRNPEGVFAVPDAVAGVKIKGQSRYTDGTDAGDREDMVLENDVIFGRILESLAEKDDPRWLGHKLIDNTLIIFTSDNGANLPGQLPGRVQESGRLRGKKAKIWEGGHRVPFLVYWKGMIDGGLNRNVFSHSDFYATFARLVGHRLRQDEAQDSFDTLDYWMGTSQGEDLRPRVFFCNLSIPYLNDALAIRVGSKKLVVNGGLAKPSMKGGSLGGLDYAMYYDLDSNPYEVGDFLEDRPGDDAIELGRRLLEIHNRGFARELKLPESKALILDDGWSNLRNDVTGAVGFEFRVREGRRVTHLGLWDAHEKDAGVRPPRNVPTEFNRDRPSLDGGKNRGIQSPHTVVLYRLAEDGGVTGILAQTAITPEEPGRLEGEFRYRALHRPVALQPGERYLLTLSTTPGDGDPFHDPVCFDGLSPLVNPVVEVQRSVLVRKDKVDERGSLPAFSDMDTAYDLHRLPVGPTLKFE